MGLTLPATDDAAELRDLLARQRRHTARVLLRLPAAAPNPALRAAHVAVAGLLRALGERAPAELVQLLAPPSLSVLVHCADAALREEQSPARSGEHVRALLPQLLFELARRGRLPQRGVQWPLPVDALWSVPGNVRVRAAATAARFEPGTVTLALAGGDVVRLDAAAPEPGPGVTVDAPYPPLAPGIALALHDASPIAMNEAHPDKEGNRVDLGGHAPEEWAASLRESLELVAAHLPGLRAEMDAILGQVVPVGWDAEKHLSASFKEAIGTIYLTLHPRAITMVEAVVHEFQHNKVNALAHLDPVLENAFWPLYASPVRPDPRPLWGVLLAVHAFVPVAELYRRLDTAAHPLAQAPGFRERWRAIIAGNGSGLRTLQEHAQPTAAGRALLDELGALQAGHEALDP